MVRARQLVESGMAEWVVIRKDPVEIPQICPFCLDDEILKRSCSNCDKSGKIIRLEFTLARSNDIVRVALGGNESGCETFRSVMSKQAPRAATIEPAHIFRAYVNGYKEDQERIEEYGRSNASFLNSLIVPFKPDPSEGRILFPFGADDRTTPKLIRR